MAKEFDLTVHHRASDGKIANTSPYKYVCDRDRGNHFVRDGVKFFPNGEVMPEVKEAAQPVQQAKPAVSDKPKTLG